MLAVRLPKDIENRLAELASQTGRTKTFYAKEAILAHLDDMEDRYPRAFSIGESEQTYFIR